MNRSTTMMIALGLVLMFAAMGSADIMLIYGNDFGTRQQVDNLYWISQFGAGARGIAQFGPGTGIEDLDGDGLYEAITMDAGFGSAAGTKCIYAPLYHLMHSLTLSGWGSGNAPNWNTGVSWRMSYDVGDLDDVSLDNWPWQVGTSSITNGMEFNTISGPVCTGDPDDPNCPGVYRVWMQLNPYNVSGTWNYWQNARTAALKLEGVIVPGQIGDRVLVYKNDLGTFDQRAEWRISGHIAYEETSVGWEDGFYWGITGIVKADCDTDNDGLSAGLALTQPSDAHAWVKVSAPPGLAFKDPVATCYAYSQRLGEDGSYARLRLSLDAVDWNVISPLPPNPWPEDPCTNSVWHDLTASALSEAEYDGIESFWVQVQLFAPPDADQEDLPKVRTVLVTAELAAPPERYCGEPGTTYLLADINQDCRVDLLDLALLARQWLECNDPYRCK